MNEQTLLIVAFISLCYYGINLLLDVTYSRPLSAHTGYGIISIISTYQIIPALGICLALLFIVYSGVILACWLEKKKHNKQ